MKCINTFDKIFFTLIIFPLILLYSLKYFFNYQNFFFANEFLGNSVSALVVIIIFLTFNNLTKDKIEKKLIKFFFFFIILEILINYIFIYNYLLPRLNIYSTEQLYFFGDTGLIHDRIIKYHFYDQFSSLKESKKNLLNNPGVLFIYDLFYSVFGKYPSVTVPWTALVTSFYSYLSFLISKKILNDTKPSLFVPILIFFLPSYFVYPLLYRDHYLILLILFTTYLIIQNYKFLSFRNFFYMFLLSFLFFFLRKIYVILPITFYIIYNFYYQKSYRRNLVIFLILSIIIFIIIFAFNKNYILANSYERNIVLVEFFKKNLTLDFLNYIVLQVVFANREGGALISLTEQLNIPFNYFFRIIYLLLSPFPWYQKIDYPYGFYQILIYVQIFISLIIYIKIFSGIIKKQLSDLSIIFLLFFLVIFILAIFGSLQFSFLYISIGLPLLIISITKTIKDKLFISCIFSFFLIVMIHVAYYFANLLFI